MKTVVSCKFYHERLGRMNVVVRSNAKRIIVRYRNGIYHVTLPEGVPTDYFRRFLEDNADALEKMQSRHKGLYFIGFQFDNGDLSFEIVSDPSVKVDVACRRFKDRSNPEKFVIAVNPETDLEDPGMESVIKSLVMEVAGYKFDGVVECEAMSIVSELGLGDRVKEIRMGYGAQRLGCCSRDGIITLSKYVMLLPRELRRHIITHELAHLDHFDHSKGFYEKWREYEPEMEELERALKGYDWPVRR